MAADIYIKKVSIVDGVEKITFVKLADNTDVLKTAGEIRGTNVLKKDLAAPEAPGVNQDSSQGYSIGSECITTDGGIYECTSAAVGAAAWAHISESYTHNQSSASATWNITHNLNRFPAVTIVDSAGDVVIADINHTNSNNLIINFGSSFSGKAYLT